MKCPEFGGKVEKRAAILKAELETPKPNKQWRRVTSPLEED